MAKIDVKAKLSSLYQEPIYPGPEVDPSTVDWMNLPQRWVASFKIGDGTGFLHIPLPSATEANNLNLNATYVVSIDEG